MSFLKQYTVFYEDNATTIESNSSDVLNARRKVALEYLRSNTDVFSDKINALIDFDYGVNINGLSYDLTKSAIANRLIPNISSNIIYCLNDTFIYDNSKLEAGISVKRFSESDSKSHESDLADDVTDSISAFNALFLTDCIVIDILPKAKITKPIQINLISFAKTDIASFRKILLNIGEGAEATVIFNVSSAETNRRYLISQVTDINIGNNAKLSLCDIDTTSEKTTEIMRTNVYTHDRDALSFSDIAISKGNVLHHFNISLDGDETDILQNGLVLASGSRKIDIISHVNHRGHHDGQSRQNFKYVLDGEANGSFIGEITVGENAKRTNAYQTNKNLLLSTTAKMHTEPQLIIYNDDVKCSHGASTGQLDPNALFYMQQRGIPMSVARTMLTQAFVSDIIDYVPVDVLREKIRLLVEHHLYNHSNRPCDNCKMGCDSLKD